MAKKVLVTRDMGEEAMVVLGAQEDFEIVAWPHDRTADKSWILENIEGCEGILVTLSDKTDEEIIAKAGPNLRMVSTMSVGYEHIELDALTSRKLPLGYTPDVLTDAVADIVVMLALMACRQAAYGISVVEKGEWGPIGWKPFGFCGPQLGSGPTGKPYTVGFLGFGRISQATLHRLIPFGITKVVYTDSGRGSRTAAEDEALVQKYAPFGQLKEIKRVSLDELASESDLVITLAPGGEKTRHIINTSFLSKMKPSAILVNPGRGTLVDSDALVEALNKGQLYAAALDVVEGEPHIGPDHPLVKCPKVTIVPHIGSATNETRGAMAMLAVKNLIAGVRGEQIPVEVKLY